MPPFGSNVLMHERIEAAKASAKTDGQRTRLRERLESRFTMSVEAPARFVEHYEGEISRACEEMAHRFARGGRLIAFGSGAQATDARHVAVEFVHPVLVGKRALPALALVGETHGDEQLTDQERPGPFARQMRLLGRPHDIAMGISSGSGGDVAGTISQARSMGMMTVALTGARQPGDAALKANFVFEVDEHDPLVVQEVHEMLYHILWELVHVFLEHRTVGT